MTLYSSQTDNSAAALKTKPQTTSKADTEEVKSYRFENTTVKFTESNAIAENPISEETEKNFYKKAFETKGL